MFRSVARVPTARHDPDASTLPRAIARRKIADGGPARSTRDVARIIRVANVDEDCGVGFFGSTGSGD